jgi:hypothetical protein
MARRSGFGTGGPLTLTPRPRRIGGWVVAAALVLGIALVVGILGDPDDGAGTPPSPSTSTMASFAAISFGTALDSASGEVAADARIDRFADGDLFTYSVPPSGAVPQAVYVEVQRTGGGAAGVVQEPIEPQALPNPAVIAFRVPAADLLAVFGAGEYLMLIYADPAGEPIAEGRFVLVGPDVSPAPSA